ncbi:MAG: hypothetical protein F6K21_02430 [Symploca sp. SIO2D2]|nr:hypothetical protein [Symploca sp. SIO2D2]
MNPAEIPLLNLLLHLFKRLRWYGFPLGIEDYMLVLQALQAGFGIGDRQALERLCCTLWAKSEEETRQIHQLLNEMLEKPDIYRELPPDSESPLPISETSNALPSQTSSPKPEEPVVPSTPQPTHKTSNPPPSPTSSPEPEEPTSETSSPADLFPDTEPEQVIQAIRSSHPDSLEMRYSPESEARYLPVTSRQMKQSWRFLRRPVREGKLEELDVPGTVDKFCREGILLEPVLMPRYSNRAELVLLVDQGGSMVPFHHLSRQLVDKARRGGNIKQIKVYYFYNYPEKYLYSDPTRLKAQLVTEVLASIGERAGVLIVSDAGAARGNYNLDRVEYTQKFLQQLTESVRYYAWLNPMPDESWQYTTAGKIARLVPMFEMSRQGLNAAINTLRGRYVYWEYPYQWML